MGTMTTLNAARASLATIPGVASCAIGLEANIGPADYPLIRLVPSRLTPGRPYNERTVETLIYFGASTTLSEGLPTVYDDLFAIEEAIIAKVKAFGGRYIETLTDEDRLDAYKLMTVRADLLEPHQWTGCMIACASVVETLGASPVVLAPFTSTALNSDADDWTPALVDGAISRALNGATETRTRVTLVGTVTGADGAEVVLGAYKDGALLGNRLVIATAGAATPVAFSLSAVGVDTGIAVFDVRATGSAGDYTFVGLTLTAEVTSATA